MNISVTAKAWVESLQNQNQNHRFGILTPPKEPEVWSKKVSEILPSWDIPGSYSYKNSRVEYLTRNTSCMW
jgi:hypothetical protein